MTQFGITESDLEYIVGGIKQFQEIEAASIFGSRAIGNYKRGSDIDIVLYGSDVTTNTLSKLLNLLENEGPLPYKFDLVAYSKIDNPKFIKHIDSHGKSIY